MRTFDDVIEAFGGPAGLAEAIRVHGYHAQLMKDRGSIPPTYWLDTVEAARRRGIRGVTLKTLASFAAQNRPAPVRPKRHRAEARV